MKIRLDLLPYEILEQIETFADRAEYLSAHYDSSKPYAEMGRKVYKELKARGYRG